MENKTSALEPLFERIEEYGKTSYELYKLKVLDIAINVISSSLSRGLAILSLSIFFSIINIGIALWLGDLLGKLYYGFFCVAGFYGVLGIILYFFLHNSIKKMIGNLILTNNPITINTK